MRAKMLEAAEAMSGTVVSGDPTADWNGIALDSRAIRGGEIFFALAGEQADGHRFVGSALAAGAAGAVIERVPEPRVGDLGFLIQVPDAYRALHDLTRWARNLTPKHLVGITGSAGKTTTKDLLATMLAAKFRVAPSPGNFNNLFGFPLALLGIPRDTEWMVAEMGMSTPGELGGVSRLGRPDIAIFTNIAPVHLEQLGSVEQIVEAKAELLEGLEDDGLVIANADDPNVLRIASRHPGRVLSYGLSAGADVRAADLQSVGVGTHFVLISPQGEAEIRLPLIGEYNVYNFLAAAACALELGVLPEAIAASAAAISPSKMRGEVYQLEDGVTVIDDSYNSNPEAAIKALDAARKVAGTRHWAVLGSMLELGPDSHDYHAQVGVAAAEKGFSLLVAVGDDARHMATAASDLGVETLWFADRESAMPTVQNELRAGDTVLVKGSRGIGLERIVEGFLGGAA